MRSAFIVVLDPLLQESPQMLLVERDDVIEELSANRSIETHSQAEFGVESWSPSCPYPRSLDRPPERTCRHGHESAIRIRAPKEMPLETVGSSNRPSVET